MAAVIAFQENESFQSLSINDDEGNGEDMGYMKKRKSNKKKKKIVAFRNRIEEDHSKKKARADLGQLGE